MKSKLVIFSAALIFLMSAAAYGQYMNSSFYHDGNSYTVDIRSDDLKDTPSWNPETEDAAPLSSREAVKIAKSNLARFVTEAVDYWQLDTLSLNQMGQNKWYYQIIFRCRNEECRAEYNTFTLYIKMDGKLVEPKVKREDDSK